MFRYHTQKFFVSTTRVKNVLMNFYKEKLEKNAFLPFSATRWGRNRSDTPFSNSQRPITPILTPYPTLQPFVSYICSLIRLGQVSLYDAMLFIPISLSYICSLIRLGQVRLYAAMLFIPIFVLYIYTHIRLFGALMGYLAPSQYTCCWPPPPPLNFVLQNYTIQELPQRGQVRWLGQ